MRSMLRSFGELLRPNRSFLSLDLLTHSLPASTGSRWPIEWKSVPCHRPGAGRLKVRNVCVGAIRGLGFKTIETMGAKASPAVQRPWGHVLTPKRYLILSLIGLLQACSHPLAVEGEGDIISNTERGCTLAQFRAGEDVCAKNLVVRGYQVVYKAVPRAGWTFSEWKNCPGGQFPDCSFDVKGGVVFDNWGKTVPALVAVFEQETNGTPIQALSFADPLLAQCVQSAAQSNGWKGSLDVTRLTCAEDGIRLLGGLQSLRNLEDLNLRGNPMFGLDALGELAKLKTVNLSASPNIVGIDSLMLLNGLTSVNLNGSGDGELTCASLDALSNKGVSVTRPEACKLRIADVDFADPALKACVAAEAALSQLVFTREIVQLDCPDAGIAQLDGLEQLENLQGINFSGNQVTDLTPLANLASLESIDASANPITDLSSLGQPSALKALNLAGIEGLQSVEGLLAIGSLDEVKLNDSGFQDLSCESLDKLANQVDSLNRPASCTTLIRDVAFEDAALRNCVLQSAASSGITFTSQFAGLLGLECVNLGIKSLVGMEEFGNLQNLTLSDNEIDDLTPLSGLVNLSGLNLNGNDIKNFYPLSRLPEVREVSAGGNTALVDIRTLVYMDNLFFVNLTGSGVNGQISCADLDLLEQRIGKRLLRPTLCSTGSAIVGGDRINTDANDDGSADLILEYRADSGVSTGASLDAKFWGFGVAATNRFDTGGLALGAFDTSRYSRARAIAVADANGDGRDDMLVQLDAKDGSVAWQVHQSDGSGGLGLTMGLLVLPDGIGNDARAVAFRDINGDSIADILVQQQVKGLISYHLSIGTGTDYGPLAQIYNFDPSLGRPKIIALEDVNNDGTADLVFDRFNGQHCYFVRLYLNGAFERQPRSRACYESYSGPGWTQVAAGVADMNGDGRSELVIQHQRKGHYAYWDYLSFSPGQSGSEWGSLKYIGGGSMGAGQSVRTIAVADIDNDGRADILNEVTIGTTRIWQAYLASAYGQFVLKDWLTGGFTNYRTLGVRDYNNDGRLDLLIEVPQNGTLTQRLYVKINDGTAFSGPWNIWYEDVRRPRVVGLEEDGLTSIANDGSAVVAWMGLADTPYYTPNEIRALLASKGLALKQASSQPLKENECEMSWTDAKGAKAGIGTMTCLKRKQGGLSLEMQGIYGGCGLSKSDVPVGSVPVNGICSAGVFRETIEVTVGGVTQTTKAGFATADACNTISFSGGPTCVGASANLASVSQTYTVNGTGVGAGLSAGVGLEAGGSVKDGVISGSVDVAFIAGVSVEFSVNYEALARGGAAGVAKTRDFLIKNGATSVVFVGDNAVGGVVAAGSALFDAYNSLSGVQKTAVGDAVYIAVGGTSAAAVIITKKVLESKTTDQVISGVESGLIAVGGVVEDTGEAIIDIGEGIGQGVGAGASWIGDKLNPF